MDCVCVRVEVTRSDMSQVEQKSVGVEGPAGARNV